MHICEVTWTPDSHGYPCHAQCSCGWQSWGYVAAHAAQATGDDHLARVS
jgi:hypothetical protein